MLTATLQSATAEDIRVTEKQHVLFDVDARRAELEAMSTDERSKLCKAADGSLVSNKVKTHLKSPKSGGADSRAEPFLWSIMNATAQYFAFGDKESLSIVRANYRRWSKGGGMMKLRDQEYNVYYSLDRALLPIIINWSLLRRNKDIPKVERDSADAWIDEVFALHELRRRHINLESDIGQNNHQLLHDSVDMAYGILKGSHKRFRRGLEGYRNGLSSMREDGSLPLETQRGARALWYQRHAIASLVSMHMMARTQGIDVRADEKKLLSGINFLFDAIVNSELVAPYARANVNPRVERDWRNQDMSFLLQRGHGRHYMAWLEAYLTLVDPSSVPPLVAQIMTPATGTARPMIDDYSGGNMSCFFGRPDS